MEAKEAGWLLRAFGDGTRLRIIALLTHRPHRVSELARALRRPMPAVTRHLRYLHARGLVEWQTVDGGVLYRLTPSGNPLKEAVLAALQRRLDLLDEVPRDRARATTQRPTRGR